MCAFVMHAAFVQVCMCERARERGGGGGGGGGGVRDRDTERRGRRENVRDSPIIHKSSTHGKPKEAIDDVRGDAWPCQGR